MNYFIKGRRCGVPGAGRPKSQKTIEKEKQEEAKRIALQQEKFDIFEKATSGNFNGFDFVEQFHNKYNKADAVFVCEADDIATAKTPFGEFATGCDGIKCYFMTTKPTKRVEFNKSVYFI